MAGNDELAQLKIKLGIDSSTFDKGIASTNRKLKILETEFKAATVGVNKFDDSAEHLAKTQDYLSKKLDLQRIKADDLRKQYQKLAEDEGKNSKAAENMMIRYQKVTAEMRRNEVSLEGVTKKIQEQGTEFSKTSKTVDAAIKSIKQDLKVADSAYKAASEGAKKLGDENKQLEVEANHLTKTLSLQEKEVEQLKKKYDLLSNTKGKDAQETKEALIKYNESIATMNKTGVSLDRVNDKIKEHSDEWGKTSRETEQALNKISQDIKVLESEYKAATAGIEKFGSSTEDLQTQAQHLEKRLSLERKEVEQLNTKYQEAVRVKGKDAQETKELAVQYNNATAKAKETETKMNHLNNTIAEQSTRLGTLRRRLNDSQQSFEDFGNRAQGIGTGIAAGFGIATAAVGGGLAAATKKSMDFEAQLSSIQALTGLSSQEMMKMRDLSMDMGAKTKYSALEAAQGMEELLKAGLTPAQVQSGALQAALNLATAGGLDLAKAAEIMSTGLNAYKSDGMSAAKASNILAGAANASATSVEELQYGLAQVGAVASGVGLSFEDTNAALGVFANNGLKGSDAGTSLKTMLGNLSPKTKAQYTAFEELGLMALDTSKAMEFLSEQGVKPASKSVEDITAALQEYARKQVGAKKYNAEAEKTYYGLGMATGYLNNAFYDANGNLENMSTISGSLKEALTGLTSEQRQQYLYTLFGSDAIRAGNILYKEGKDGIIEFKKAMGNVTAEEVAVKKMDNLAGRIEQLRGSFETLQITVGKALEPIAEFGVKVLQKLVDGFNNLPKGMQKAVAISGAVAAGLLGIVTVGGALLAFVGTASLGVSALAGGLGALGIGAGAAAGGLGAAGAAAGVAGAAAGGAAGGVGLLGTALAALTGPIGIGIASVAALTAGSVLLWKNWDKVQATFDKNPFVKFLAYANPVSGAMLGIVGTGKKIQSMYDEVIPKADLFAEGVSKSTAKALGAYMKLDEQASTSLMSMYAKQQVITDQNMAMMMGKYDAMTSQVVGKLDSRYKKEYSMAEKLFADTSALSSKEEAKILANMDTWHGQEKAKIEGYQAKIKAIYQKAKDEKRTITESEYLTIKGIQEQMRTSAVQTLSKSEAEQKMILGRLENAAGQITARQAAKVIQNSYKQKTESVKHANAQYKETVHNIEYMRDVTGQITAAQAKKLIADAKHQRDKSVAHAESMHQKVVEEAKAQAKGHGKWIDSETGKVANGWDKMWSKVSDTWDKILGIFGVEPKSKAVHKKGDNTGGYDINAGGRATGTPNGGHPGGWAITSEQGRELIHEPGKGTYLSGNSGSELRYLQPGSSVLPNHRTEQFLKKYGFDGNKIPGYEGGVGDYFDKIMEGPGAIWDSVTKKVGGLTDSLLPDYFTKATGSITGRIKDAAIGKIQNLIDDWMGQFGSDGEGTTGVVGPGSGMGGMQPYVEKWYNLVKNKFGKTHFMGGYANRDMVGGSSKSKHAYGQAFDIGGSKQTMASIAEYLRKTANNLGYVIYNHRIAGPGVGKAWRAYGGGGKNPHTDHVHADFNGPGGGGSAGKSGKSAQAWRSSIVRAAAQMGEPATAAQINGIIAQIHRESRGNERAIQGKGVMDVNMRRGDPAKGLLQYISGTWRAYAMKGHSNIFSGYDQLLAFFNNRNWRKDLPYGKRGWGPTGGRKYEQGGLIDREQLATVGEGNKREMIIPLEKHRDRARMLWTQAGEVLGMFGKGKTPAIPSSDRSAVQGNTGNSQEMINLLKEQNSLLMEQTSYLIQLLAKSTKINVNMDGQAVFEAVETRQTQQIDLEDRLRG